MGKGKKEKEKEGEKEGTLREKEKKIRFGFLSFIFPIYTSSYLASYLFSGGKPNLTIS